MSKHKMVELILGKNPKVRFHRLTTLIMLGAWIMFMLSGLKSCGYNKKDGPYFHFGQSIDINKVINKKGEK